MEEEEEEEEEGQKRRVVVALGGGGGGGGGGGFERRKKRTLEMLGKTTTTMMMRKSDFDDEEEEEEEKEEDKSRAGRVDERMREFVNVVNGCENVCTTSSCSGRVSVFAERTEEDVNANRKGGEWVFVSHEAVEENALITKVKESLSSTEKKKTLTLRFEPFILAVETKDEYTAQMFVKCARDAGYRESGVVSTVNDESNSTSASGRIISSARCSIRMEALVAKDGEMLLGDEGLKILVEECNKKMRANWERADRFFALFKERFCSGMDRKNTGVRDTSTAETTSSGNNDNTSISRTTKKAAKECWFLVDSLCAKTCKDALKQNGWLDQSRKSVYASIEEAKRKHLVVDNPKQEERKSTKNAENENVLLNKPLVVVADGNDEGKENTGGDGKKVKKPKALPPKKSFVKLPVIETNAFVQLMDKKATVVDQSTAPIHSAISLNLATFIIEDVDAPSNEGNFTANAPNGNSKILPPAALLASRIASTMRNQKERGITCTEKFIETVISADVPKKWEKLGDDLVLLPKSAFEQYREVWEVFPPWEHVSQCLKVSRIFRQDAVSQGPKRESRAVSLYGNNDGWVEHKELGVTYGFDCSKVMFSSGNGTEKKRMGFDICARNETIVDLYAGIGYYTLQLLKNGNAKHVYACEWNSNSCKYLRWNLKKNNIEANRCDVLEGDNREVAPKNVADRVLLGLLPTSRDAWSVAVDCLKAEKGGTCHVHECVDEGGFEKKGEEILAVMREMKPNWNIRVEHVEKVKKYAPRVWHLVYDIVLRPPMKKNRSDQMTRKDSMTKGNTRKEKLRFVKVLRSHRPKLDEIRTVTRNREPVVFTGMDVGSCAQMWTPKYLLEKSPTLANSKISAHVSSSANFDFARKNFKYESLVGKNFFEKVCSSSSKEFLYLRSLGADPRKFEPAMALEQFPELARDVRLPSELWDDKENALHSVVLRVSSPNVKIWTHYDAMDNVLIQLSGTKRVVLFPPKHSGDLYLKDSSSMVSDIDDFDTNDVEYPRFRNALENAQEVILQPGDCLFIPALWAHRCESGSAVPSVALNAFFRDLEKNAYPAKDAYANADPIIAREVLSNIDESIDKLKTLPNQHGEFYASVASANLARAFGVDVLPTASIDNENNKQKTKKSNRVSLLLKSACIAVALASVAVAKANAKKK